MPRLATAPAMLLAILGGLATDAAFPGRSWWPLAPVGVALLLLALRGRGVFGGMGTGLLWGLSFFLPHLYWAHPAAGLVPWFLLGFAQALFIAVFGGMQSLAHRWTLVQARPWLGAILTTALWVSVEQLRGVAPFGGLPWGMLAFSQTSGPLLRAASLGGVVLISAVVVLLAVLTAHMLVALRRGSVWRAGLAVCAGAIILLASAIVPVNTRAEAGHLRVAAVQGNVPGTGLDAFAVRRDVVERHAAGTEALAERFDPGDLDVVLWPENSSDVDPRVDAATATLIDDAARAVDAPILVGTQRYTENHRYNESVLWEPGQGVTDVYTKQHPAPFAEYIPLRDLARRVTDAVDLVTVDMLAGTEPGIIELASDRHGRTVPLAVGICFEVAYSDIVREAVVEGGELIVIPTNNASFGYTQESEQQLAMSVFRAVEHARATVHVSTVGKSALIAPNGVIIDSGGHFTAEQLSEALPLRTSLTLATRLGPWPAIAAAILAGLGLLGAVAGRRVAPGRALGGLS
ncbi:MAG TPA: apolipoprotein N-acyltransferase [Actinomycetaceae bacterium]|nr:apolipoprotein N-acyltransferase [Actinomycetaceae bacterium]